MSVSPTAGGFDALAPGYDSDFGSNPIGRWMRQRTWQRMDARFAPGSHILEFGCGTGIDLVRLAGQGHHVTAVDISPAMADVARQKAAALHLQPWATVLCGDLSSGDLPAEVTAGAPFDGLLSNFGALNCVEDLPVLLRRLHGLLKPGAPFLACLMTRPCPWETAWYLLRLQPGEAFRRYRRGGVDVRLGEYAVRTGYQSAGGYAGQFSHFFLLDHRLALGVVVPPPYLEGLAGRYPRLFRLACRIEARLAHCRPFSLAGDHTLFEMTAKGGRR
jgi:SAM-dependent methyltransferase